MFDKKWYTTYRKKGEIFLKIKFLKEMNIKGTVFHENEILEINESTDKIQELNEISYILLHNGRRYDIKKDDIQII